MTHYRVRLLQLPVILYSGQSYDLASHILDSMPLIGRVLEREALNGDWRSVISVDPGQGPL